VLSKLVNLTFFNVSIVIMMFIISILSINNLFLVLFQMLSILGVGFYFSTLVRVSYFKINHYIAHSSLVSQFAVFEFLAALLAYLFTKQSHYPIFVLLWIGYIAKYFFQLLILRKKYTDLSYMVRST
jgi:hypothetical protein